MERSKLVTLASHHDMGETLARLRSALHVKGIGIFAEIDHAAGAADVGMDLRPTTVVIFGNPAAGTPLMQLKQQVGLDLPLRVLVWQDEHGKVWLTYRDPASLADEHGLEPGHPALKGLASALAGLAQAATAP